MSYSDSDLKQMLAGGSARIKSVNGVAVRARKKPHAINLVERVQGGRILSLAFAVPLQVVSEANQREHWTQKHKRNQAQQAEIAAHWPLGPASIPIALPCAIELTRIGVNALDSDNLAGAFKHVRDSIARLIGIDDGSDLIEWRYSQRRGGGHSIEVRIKEKGEYEQLAAEPTGL